MKSHEKKKAKILDEEETYAFMTKAPNRNRYWLVRKAIVAVNLYGGLRGEEMRNIDRKDVKPTTEGFEITYIVSKRREEIKRNK
jgi:integrase